METEDKEWQLFLFLQHNPTLSKIGTLSFLSSTVISICPSAVEPPLSVTLTFTLKESNSLFGSMSISCLEKMLPVSSSTSKSLLGKMRDHVWYSFSSGSMTFQIGSMLIWDEKTRVSQEATRFGCAVCFKFNSSRIFFVSKHPTLAQLLWCQKHAITIG